MSTQKEERTIFAFKLHSKSNPDQGDIRPIAEIVDDKLIELDASNFCHTQKVYVPKEYQLIDEKFDEGEIFRINVMLNQQISANVDPYAAAKYKTIGSLAERLRPIELIEVIEGELPDRNNRYFENNFYPGTKYICIRNNRKESFGVFSCKKEGNSGFLLELLNDTPILKSYQLNLGQILKVKNGVSYLTTCSVENKNRYFILNIHDFLKEYEYYDYASDEEIVRHCSKLASEIGATSINKASWDSFRKLAGVNAKFNQGLNKDRLNRLSNIIDNIVQLHDDTKNNIEIFLKSDGGKNIIDEFIKQKRPQLLEPLRKEIIAEKDKEIKERDDKISQIEEIRLKKEKEFKELSAEVERKRKEANQEVILESAVAERNEKLQYLDKQIIEKECQFEVITKKLNLSDDLNEINQKIEEGKVISKHYERENSLLEATKKQLKNECGEEDDKLRKKLMDLKPYVETINGSFVFDKRERRNVFVKLNNITNTSDTFEQQHLIIETVKHNLELKGRYFESWQIANFLISIQQSFIVFLAGLPGVGKTSLARLIAETQNLQPRLQEISVARGWTSQKDLIGFYNPLSNRFQSANTGLYAFIEALNFEKKEEQAMAYVLLDEANLSPIEHYWSAFMAMADGEGEQVLRLGQDTIVVPTTLRFLATINYDGTTEPLAQRMVDRAPVLVMESAPLDKNDISDIDKLIDLPLSAIEMNKLFGLAQDAPPFLDEEKVIFDKVRNILSNASLEKGRPLSVSQRKEKVIRQYCDKARYLMGAFGCDDFKALDLAVLQHILPQVRGNGQKFAERLNELKQACDEEGLKDSAKYLERMLAYGKAELHSYDFFCW